MKINRSVRVWFLVHFMVDYIAAIPLFLFPFETLAFLGWRVIDPITARVVAAAFLAIGGVSFAARNADEKTYYHLLVLKIIWSVMATAALIMIVLQGSAPWGVWVSMVFFMLFGSAWGYYWLKLRRFTERRIIL